MRLLLFSDLHGSVPAAEALVSAASGVDVVVGAGDLATIHAGLGPCLHVLARAGRPLVLVPGNNETEGDLVRACAGLGHVRVLHGTSVELAGVTFFGLGGGVPVTPFGAWSFDLTEEEAAVLLAPVPRGCVLVSHAPPQGTVDRSARGRSIGSTAVRDAILRTAPVLVVCGHVHASAGETGMVGRTPVVNAGPRGMVWTVPG